MTDTAPLTDQQLDDIRKEMAEARVSLMMFRSVLGSTMGQISDTIAQIGRGTAPLKQAQREAAMYRARWESTVREAKRQHAEADRLRAERDQFADRVDTLTAVAQSNAKAQRVAYEESEQLRAALSAIGSDAERAARKGYDLDPEDIRAALHTALTAVGPTT